MRAHLGRGQTHPTSRVTLEPLARCTPTGFSSTVLWALLATGDSAGEREPNVRTLLLPDPSRGQVPTLHVGERLTTVLRLEQACVPARTTLLGWEGRFEPVLCHGRAVYLHPVRELAPEDRFLLRVTLADGTEWPFTVAGREHGSHRHPVDQQVEVFTEPEGVEDLRAALSRRCATRRSWRSRWRGTSARRPRWTMPGPRSWPMGG
ncbi:DUF2381 family protein [Cystobacter ferrugineus]|uniref:DUF2381 family protein n=1 Tax=Cystobacter ferrugineus TaxID=83449 RepID=UPI000B1FE232|nr:DUF2381 family protein [Cystobacter ferrugineus]